LESPGSVKKPLFWTCITLSLAGGSFAWWVDSRNDEPQAAVLVILVATILLGFLMPRRAWLWASLVGLCIPVGYLLARSLGYLPQTQLEPGWYGAFIALIPAFVGAYIGALGSVIIKTATVKTQ
jgi:hypothetical protein